MQTRRLGRPWLEVFSAADVEEARPSARAKANARIGGSYLLTENHCNPFCGPPMNHARLQVFVKKEKNQLTDFFESVISE
jgi:hypothetical protein